MRSELTDGLASVVAVAAVEDPSFATAVVGGGGDEVAVEDDDSSFAAVVAGRRRRRSLAEPFTRYCFVRPTYILFGAND